MKAAIAEGNGKLSLREVPIPKPNAYQCLCKIQACASCSGTDQKIIENKLFAGGQQYPGILGHESVGEVIETGGKVRNIKKGDIYLRPAAIYQGEKMGDLYSLWGGFAEYGLVTDLKALKEDDPKAKFSSYAVFQQPVPRELKISPEDATMIITLKEVGTYIRDTGVKINNSMMFLGAGSVAANMIYCAKIFGAVPVIAVARRDEQLAEAKKIGANSTINVKTENFEKKIKELTGGKGADFIIDTAGDDELTTEAVKYLAPGGKIAVYAVNAHIGGAVEAIKKNKKQTDNWDFIYPGKNEDGGHNYLLDLVRIGGIELKKFYSDIMPFKDVVKGFEMLKNKKASKIVFKM